jgi:microcystin-dependent protein
MSLSTTVNKVIHDGNSSATSFSYTFPILASSELSVIYTDADGADTTLSASEYSVTGIGGTNGGAVTYPLVGSAIATGTRLTILRTVPYTQDTVFSNQGGYYPEVVEARFDRVYMALQQIYEQIGRGLVTPITDASPLAIPQDATARAGQALLFDSLGNPYAGSLTESLVGVSPFIASNLLPAASAAAARTAIGATGFADVMAIDAIKTSAGSSTVYTLTDSAVTGALADGMTHTVQFHIANGNAPTLNVNGLGAKAIHYYSVGAWRAVPAGLWATDQVLKVTYHSGSATYRLIGFDNHTGEGTDFAGTTAPAGTLLCFGQSLVRADFAGLFAALGTTYGSADGTHFNLPDVRDRVVAGKGNMGGSAASRLSTASLTAANTLGATGGFETRQSDTNSGGGTGRQAGADNVAQDGHTHNTIVVQPTIILNYVVRI